MDKGSTAPDDLLAPPVAARAAGLRYVSDDTPGHTRRRHASGFRYCDAAGRPIRDREVLARIESLAIPPAWTQVWICPHATGHLQATGRDARGRKQYRYHPRWQEVRNETKFERMLAFGAALPAIRRRVQDDLARPGLPREKVLAAVVRLLETTLIRIGNEEYARENRSFGLTTMRRPHVAVEGAAMHFRFRGKGGAEHRITLRDRRLARIVKRCQELPGQALFHYVDEEGEVRSIDSADVNDYLREITGEEFTAKDFRTWAGTLCALGALQQIGAADTAAQGKKNLVEAIRHVAKQLGNTPAVCRKYYIHPAVLECYSTGMRLPLPSDEGAEPSDALDPQERQLLRFLASAASSDRRLNASKRKRAT
jgi:DNA topoisomerase I